MTQFRQEDTTQDWGQKGFRMLLALACLFVVLAGMKAAAGILVPIACAFFLAVLSYPFLLWLTRHRVPHPIAMGATVAVPGTEGGYEPFWSPDNRFLGFFQNGKLKKISVNGGPTISIADCEQC